MPNPHNEKRTYTRKLSREINAAYEAYKAGVPDGWDRLFRAFVAAARNIALFRLGEMYDGTVVYDAAHRAMLALNDFHGRGALSTWFFRIVQNESSSELARLIKKREREESINVPVRDGEPGETEVMDIPEHLPDQAAALDLAKLRIGLPPEQAEVLDFMAEGYSLGKIAKKLGLPIGTVRSRYRLAKEHMKRKMKKAASRSDMK